MYWDGLELLCSGRRLDADQRLQSSVPGWLGWDASFKLYSGIPPVATEPTTWGKIKANYR